VALTSATEIVAGFSYENACGNGTQKLWLGVDPKCKRMETAAQSLIRHRGVVYHRQCRPGNEDKQTIHCGAV